MYKGIRRFEGKGVKYIVNAYYGFVFGFVEEDMVKFRVEAFYFRFRFVSFLVYVYEV